MFTKIYFLSINLAIACKFLLNRMAGSLFIIMIFVLLLNFCMFIKYFLYFIIYPYLTIVVLLFLLQNLLLS